MCSGFLYNVFPETFLILTREERDIIKNYSGLHVKYKLFLSDFNETYFPGRFSKNHQISNFTTSHPVGVALLHVDGRTDLMKLIVAFRNFVNAPKNGCVCICRIFSTQERHVCVVYWGENITIHSTRKLYRLQQGGSYRYQRKLWKLDKKVQMRFVWLMIGCCK